VVEFDDRALTHLQIVILQKFRRGESFPMSWVDDVRIGAGRGMIWLTPAVPIYFRFEGSRVPSVDQAWIDVLAESANGPRGLVVTDASGVPIKATGTGHRPYTVGTGTGRRTVEIDAGRAAPLTRTARSRRPDTAR
jgi:hypothetical protein